MSVRRSRAATPARRAWRSAVLAFFFVFAPTSAVAAAPFAICGEAPANEAPAPAPVPVSDLPGAVQAYRDGHWAESTVRFAELARAEADPARAAVLHCNAGTAAARAENWGEAVWHLRRALHLAPRDETARVNLVRVTELTGKGQSESAQFTTTLLELPRVLTRDESERLVALLASLACALLALRRVLPERVWPLRAAVAVALLAVGWLALATHAWRREESRAVIIPPTASGRAEPEPHGEVLFRLSGGAIVRLDDLRRDWRLVESEAGARGWVPVADARPLHGD